MKRNASLRDLAREARRRPPVRKRFIVPLVLVALFTVAGFFVIPPIARSQLETRLTALLGRKVTLERLQLNPYTLSVTLENFAIRDRDGTSPFLGWRRLHVNADALASLAGEWVVSEVTLDGFEARLAINADQSLSVADILARLAPPGAAPAATGAPAKPARPVRVGSLRVTDARVAFSDHARDQPFATTLGPLTFAVTEFRTVSDRGAPYHFEAATEAGEKLTWSGTLGADPVRSKGEFAIENLQLPKYAPYYGTLLHATLASGQLSLRGRYELDLTPDRQVVRLQDGSVQLRELRLLERRDAAAPAVELAALDLTGLQADALARRASIGSIALRGGNLRVRREKDGAINLLALLPAPPPSPAAPSAPAAPSPAPSPKDGPPEVTIGEIALHEFTIGVVDLAAPRPVQLGLDRVEASVRDVTLAAGGTMPVQLAFAWAPHGTVEVGGTVSLSPLKAELKTEVAGLHLLPLSPYLEQFVNARLTQGTLIARLDAKVALPAGQPPAVTLAGDIALEKIGLVDSGKNEELAGFTTLQLWGLRAGTAPELNVALEEISLAGPYARVVVNPDGTLNLATLVRPPATATGSTPAGPESPAVQATSSPATGAAALPQIAVARVTLRDGDFRFTDRSVAPHVALAINQFGGTVAGLSSRELAKADVDLKAAVDGTGPIVIKGQVDPLGPKPFVDLKVDFRNVDLLPLSPYAGKYAGYTLARGKLLLDVKVRVDGPRIEAANVITLNQFTFGDAVQSPSATKLPVRLGVALLKDLDGRIVIDVPVQGSRDDPSFGVGQVVLRVITNLLTKAAVSPFALLGAAFGGGAEELAFQEFPPGSTELQPEGLKKLQTMTQALTNRPGLGLDLRGSFDPAADAHALKRVKLADQVRRALWEKKRAADPNLPPPDQLPVSPEERAAMVKELFDAKFPPGTEFGTPVPAPPAPVAPPRPPAGWLQRVVRTLTRAEDKEARAVAAENQRLQAEHSRAVAAAVGAGRPLDEMHERLAETIEVTPDDLRALAHARAQQVRTYLRETGKIDAERLFLAKEANEAESAKGPRVFLSLQ